MRIFIISAGRYPIPATKGGAVSTLINHFVEENEKNKLADIEISSPYEVTAAKESRKLQNSEVLYIKTPALFVKLENGVYKIANSIFPRKNWTQLKSGLSFLWYVWKNALLLKRSEYDYVVIENTARLFLCLNIFNNREKYNNKIVYHLHNEPRKLGGCRNVIIESKYVLCISQYIKNSILDEHSPLHLPDSNKAKILYNCIDTKKFYPFDEIEKKKCRKEFGLAEDDKVIVFSGRIDQEKGIYELLTAMSFIKTKRVRLLVVGSSFYGMKIKTSFENRIINIAKQLGNRVVFSGFIAYEDMPKAYNAADIAVLPSMWNEPAGLTIIEAMACGKPVITTQSGGIPEYANSECAVFVERNDKIATTLAEKIDDLFENEHAAHVLGENARRHVVQNFDSGRYLSKLLEILR